MIGTRYFWRIWNRFSKTFFGFGPWVGTRGKGLNNTPGVDPRQRRLLLEHLETRWVPATATWTTGTLYIDLLNGETLTASSTGLDTISLSLTGGTFTSVTGLGDSTLSNTTLSITGNIASGNASTNTTTIQINLSTVAAEVSCVTFGTNYNIPSANLTIAGDSNDNVTANGSSVTATSLSVGSAGTGNQVANFFYNGTTTLNTSLSNGNVSIYTDNFNSAAGWNTINAGTGTTTLVDPSPDPTIFGNIVSGSVNITTLNTVNLAAVTATDLSVSTGGNPITQSGTLNVSGTTTLTAGTANITLTNTTNNFGTVQVVSSNVAQLRDTNGIVLGTGTATTLTVTATDITQSGPITVTGTTNLTAGTANITLTDAGNTFATVNVVSGNVVQITDSTAIVLGTTKATTLNVTAGGNITQSGVLTLAGNASFTVPNNSSINLGTQANSHSGSVVLFNASSGQIRDVSWRDSSAEAIPALNITGNLTFNITGNITQTGTLTVPGTSTLTAGTGNITLTDGGNTFGTVNVTSGNVVQITDSTAIILGTTKATTLNVTAGGNITQSGVLTLAGNASFTVPNNSSINLGTQANSHSGSGVLFNASSGQIRDVSWRDSSAEAIPALNITGNLTFNAAGITQSGTLTVPGTTTLTAGTANITLTDGGNTFGTVNVASGNVVQITDSTAIVLGNTTATTLNVTAGGNITQSGKLTLAGNASFTVPNASSINLGTQTNSHSGSVVLFSASSGQIQDVSWRDSSAEAIPALNITGNLTFNAAGITQSGTLTVAGTTTLTGNTGNITLTDAANTFGTVNVASGNVVQITDSTAIVLGNTTATTLNVTAGGNITQTGVLTLAGNASFTVPNTSSINLGTQANSHAGSVVLFNASSGQIQDVSWRDTSAEAIPALNITGNLTFNAAGITQTGAVIVAGTTTLTAGTGNITLTNASNDFTTLNVVSGKVANITDSTAIVLGTTTATTLNVTAGGNITQSGVLTLAGNASFTVPNASSINLGTQANSHSGSVVLFNASSGQIQDVSWFDTSAGAIPALNITGNLSYFTGGALTQSGALIVPGITTLATGTANITLANASNDFGTVNVVTGNVVQITDNNAIVLGTSTATTLSVTANGITQSAPLNISGTTTLTGGTSNITLNDPANKYATVNTASGNVVQITDSTAIILGTTKATTLNVTAGGNITQSGVLTIAGNASFTVPNASSINLGTQANSHSGSVVLFNASSGQIQDVAWRDTSAEAIPALNITGNLTFNAAGITQSGALIVPGTTTLTAGTANITLTNASNDFGTVNVVSGNVVQITDSTAIVLGNTTATTLNVTAGGNITQSGVLTLTGNASFTVPNASSINLGTQANSHSGSVVLFNATTGQIQDVSWRDTSAEAIPALNITGNLTFITGGAITQTGAVVVAGTTTLNPGASTITLTNTSNDFGTVNVVSGTTVQLRDTNSIVLGTSTATTLSVTANGITQSAPLNISGTTTLTGGTSNITLNDPANKFGTVNTASGNVVQITDSTAIILGTTKATTLNVTAGGNITQSGVLTIAGNASFTVPNASSINLGTQANSHSGSVVSFNASSGQIQDVSWRDTSAEAIPALNITGNLTFITGGALTQTGALIVPGTTSLTAGTANITLTNTSNDFGTVKVVSGNVVQITDSTAIVLGNSTATTLSVTANGITQSAPLNVSGTTTLTGGTSNITLNDPANKFATVNTASGNVVQITDSTAIVLGTTTATTLNVTAGGNITQSGVLTLAGNTSFTVPNASSINLGTQANSHSGSVVLFNATSGQIRDVSWRDTSAEAIPALNITGNLTFNAAGITQSGTLTVPGITTLTAGTNNITLDNATNVFGTVNVVSGNVVQITDSTSIVLGTTKATTLNVTAGGNITQTGVMTIAGDASFTVANGASINLGTQANSHTGSVVQFNASSGQIKDVSWRDTSAEAIPALNITGNLTFITGGAITQTGAVVVAGTTNLTAGTANITLTDVANDFATLNVVSGNVVQVTDSTAIVLGTTKATTLNITAGGNITQSGVLTLTGNASFTVPNASSINLGTQANSHSGSVVLFNASSGQIQDVDWRDTSAGAIPALNITGNLTFITGGAITQTGALVVPGTTTLNPGASTITLTNTSNDFGTVNVVSGTTVQLRDANSIVLGTGTATTLRVTAGDITQSGPLNIGGTSTLTGGTANITLNDPGNKLATVNVVSGNVVQITDSTAIVLGTSKATTLTITAGGNITQSGVLTITGNASFTVPNASSINLGTQANTHNGSVVLFNASSGQIQDVAWRDTSAEAIPALNITGNLTFNAAGITQSGKLIVPGTTTLTAGTANITLTNASNDFGTVNVVSGNVVQITDSTAIVLGNTTATTLNVSAGGNITQSGVLTLVGNASFTVPNASSINLGTQANTHSGSVVLFNASSGQIQDVAWRDTSAEAIPALNITGNLTFITGGAITQSGAVIVPGTTTLTAGTANITLTNASNDFGTVNVVSGNVLQITDGTAIVLGNSTATTLNVTGNGAISQTGPVSVSGTTTLVAGTNNITLTNASNDFGTVNVTSGNTVSLTDANTLTLGTTGAGNLTASAVGNLSQSGTATVTGATTLSSGGNITLNGVVSTGNLKATSAGTTTLNGTLSSSNSKGVVITSANIQMNTGITTTGGGPVSLTANATGMNIADVGDITSDGAVTLRSITGITTAANITTTGDAIQVQNAFTLTGDVSLSSGTGSATVRLSGNINGNFTLNLSADTGVVTLGPIGQTTPLNGVVVNSTKNLIFNQAVSAGKVQQITGTGETVINSGMATSSASGIDIRNQSITILNAGITTTGDGPVNLNATTGTLSLFPTAGINASGTITLRGVAGILARGTITTSSDDITFQSAVTLLGDLELDTQGTGGTGNITFNQTVDGAFLLGLKAGTETITFNGALGDTVQPVALFVDNASSTVLTGTVKVSQAVVIVSDNLTIGANLTVDGGAGLLAIRPSTSGTIVDLGGADAPGTLGITSAEFSRLIAGDVTLGDLTNPGNAKVTDSITLGDLFFSLQTAGDLSFSSTGSLNGDQSKTSVELIAGEAGSVTGNSDLSPDVTANCLAIWGGTGGIGTNLAPFRMSVNQLTTSTNETVDGPQFLAQNPAFPAYVQSTDLDAGTATITLAGGEFLTATNDNILSPVVLENGAILGGVGTTEGVTVNAGTTLSPGGGYPPQNGTLTATDITFVESANFNVYCGPSDTNPGPQASSVLSASGTVNLGNATLNLSKNGNVAPGQTFTVVTGASVTGTLKYLGTVLNNNDTFTFDGNVFQITYSLTSVVLTVL